MQYECLHTHTHFYNMYTLSCIICVRRYLPRVPSDETSVRQDYNILVLMLGVDLGIKYGPNHGARKNTRDKKEKNIGLH